MGPFSVSYIRPFKMPSRMLSLFLCLLPSALFTLPWTASQKERETVNAVQRWGGRGRNKFNHFMRERRHRENPLCAFQSFPCSASVSVLTAPCLVRGTARNIRDNNDISDRYLACRLSGDSRRGYLLIVRDKGTQISRDAEIIASLTPGVK